MRQLAPFLLAAALAVPVAADTPEKAAAFLGAMRDAGCTLSADGADDAAEGAGLTLDEMDAVVDLLFLGGQVQIDVDGHLTLNPDLCAAPASGDAALYARLQDEIDVEAAMQPWYGADPSGAPIPGAETGAQLLGAIRESGCSVALAESADLVARAGIAPNTADIATAILFEAGHMRFGAGPQELRLSDSLCAADPADDAAVFEASLAQVTGAGAPGDPDAVIAERFGPEGVRAVLEFLADANDCVLEIGAPDEAVDTIVEFVSINVAGAHNLSADFSPDAEAGLRATVEAVLADPGPAFTAEPGRLTLNDCTP